MILQHQVLIERAREVLGVTVEDGKNEIRYAYYRRMFQYHPDRNPDDPYAHEKTALLNEAFGIVMGRGHDALLLKQDSLVTAITSSAITEIEGILSYDEWLKQQFYCAEDGSIWAY
jgi:curved DNA-binding protein CbpA